MERFRELKEKLKICAPSLVLREHEMMSKHTTFRVGGPVSLMALPRTAEEMIEAVRVSISCGVQPVIVGNGSNLLVSDCGADVFVLKTVDGMGKIRLDDEKITAESGVLLSRLAVFAKEHGLTGLEFAHGIPGSVGGGVCMNAGAYGGEMVQVVSKVVCLAENGEIVEIKGSDCGFAYRKSIFAGGDKFVLAAEFALKKGERTEIESVMADLAQRRREKQPLEYPSAGSTFKRPAGYYAAALIEQCGLKGLRVGGAQVSEKHAGFIVNLGGATCEDILTLMSQVKERVFLATGVVLEPEVKVIGV